MYVVFIVLLHILYQLHLYIDDLYFVLQSLDPAHFSFFLLIGDSNVDFYNLYNINFLILVTL